MKSVRFGLVNTLLAIGLTFTSLLYVQPKDCTRICATPEGTPCPSGACRIGEQHAGWPLPFVVDSPGGGSPTNGWGILGPEDPPIPMPFVLDALLYSLILWLILSAARVVRRQPLNARRILVVLPLTALLATIVWAVYFFISMRTGG